MITSYLRMNTVIRAKTTAPDPIDTLRRDVERHLHIKREPAPLPGLPRQLNPNWPRTVWQMDDEPDLTPHRDRSFLTREPRQDGKGGVTGYHGSRNGKHVPRASLVAACERIEEHNMAENGTPRRVEVRHYPDGSEIPAERLIWLQEHTALHREPHQEPQSRSIAKRKTKAKPRLTDTGNRVRHGDGHWVKIGRVG